MCFALCLADLPHAPSFYIQSSMARQSKTRTGSDHYNLCVRGWYIYAQLVRSLTANQEVPGSIPGLVEGRLQNRPFLRQKSENRDFWASFDAFVKWPWPRDSFLAPFSHFTTARQNSLKNPAFRTSGEERGCFAVYVEGWTLGDLLSPHRSWKGTLSR